MSRSTKKGPFVAIVAPSVVANFGDDYLKLNGWLKEVCGVERRQMKEAQHLERALALDMIIAARVLLLTRLGKEHPDLPARVFYSPEELAVLAVKKRRRADTLRVPN